MIRESNLTAATPHIEGNGFTDHRGEQEPYLNTLLSRRPCSLDCVERYRVLSVNARCSESNVFKYGATDVATI
jgi:hypothetical protein